MDHTTPRTPTWLWDVAVVVRRYVPVLIAVAVLAALIVLVPGSEDPSTAPGSAPFGGGPDRLEVAW